MVAGRGWAPQSITAPVLVATCVIVHRKATQRRPKPMLQPAVGLRKHTLEAPANQMFDRESLSLVDLTMDVALGLRIIGTAI